MISQINASIDKIGYITDALYSNRAEDATDLNKTLNDINAIMLQLINDSSKYSEKGIDVPVDILVSQVKNMLEACDNNDLLMLADTLKYEIINGLAYYRDILLENGDIDE